MRFVVVDLRGNQRAFFDSRAELVEELREGLLADPRALVSLYVVPQDASGNNVGPVQRADEVLSGATRSLSLVLDTSVLSSVVTGATAPIVKSGQRVAGVASRQSLVVSG